MSSSQDVLGTFKERDEHAEVEAGRLSLPPSEAGSVCSDALSTTSLMRLNKAELVALLQRSNALEEKLDGICRLVSGLVQSSGGQQPAASKGVSFAPRPSSRVVPESVSQQGDEFDPEFVTPEFVPDPDDDFDDWAKKLGRKEKIRKGIAAGIPRWDPTNPLLFLRELRAVFGCAEFQRFPDVVYSELLAKLQGSGAQEAVAIVESVESGDLATILKRLSYRWATSQMGKISAGFRALTGWSAVKGQNPLTQLNEFESLLISEAGRAYISELRTHRSLTCLFLDRCNLNAVMIRSKMSDSDYCSWFKMRRIIEHLYPHKPAPTTPSPKTDVKRAVGAVEKSSPKSSTPNKSSSKRSPSSGTGAARSGSPFAGCYTCRDKTHIASQCPKAPPPERGSFYCFRCKKVGHRIEECKATAEVPWPMTGPGAKAPSSK